MQPTDEPSTPYLSGIVSTSHGDDKRQMARELRKRMTESEKALWSRLRAHQLCGVQFRRQQAIDGFIVDFYCHAAALAVKLDGAVHDLTAEYDRDRDAILSARSILILRFRNARVENDIESVLSEIAEAVVRRIGGPEG